MSWWIVLSWLGCRPAEVEVLHLEPLEGNPLVARAPLYPWPSDLFLVDDPATHTGRRLDLPEALLPEGIDAGVLDDDGFSRATTLLAWLEGGIDPGSLPDPAGSVQPDASILLLREGDFEPTPVLAEIDAGTLDPSAAALLIRPQRTLEPSTGYVVLLRDSLRTLDGGVPAPSPAFRALRDRIPTDSDTVESMRADFELLHDALAARDLDPSTIVLGWTFHTRSEAGVVDAALHLQDTVSSGPPPAWTLTSDVHEGDNRLITGTFEAPDFLGDEGRFTLEQGLPIEQGRRQVPFLLTIPDTVDEPRPVILFGHGFFSAKEEPTWSSLQHSLQPWRFSTASVDFIGFSEDDALATAPALGGDLVALEGVVHQQLQSHAHFTALARLLEASYDDIVEDRGDGAFLPLDPDRIAYLGISNGGTQGSVLLATSPHIDRGALVVPGGAWSHMMQRAVQWAEMSTLLQLKHPDPVDLQLVLSLTQQVLDPADIVNYARGLVEEPFPGRTANQVTLHMAVEDSQVANMVTEWVARDAGLPVLEPSGREIFGLQGVSAPPPGRTDLPGALFVYDEGYAPQPTGNVPPPVDNGAHETIRYLPAYTEQVGAFLEDGTIVQVCDGACDPD